MVVDGWCWFALREEYCWLVAGGWFVLREKYCWLVADKPNEQAAYCKKQACRHNHSLHIKMQEESLWNSEHSEP
jgi:hypothetical protein